MSLKTLLSDDLWAALSQQAANHQRIHAAMSYVTAKHLDFREGDLLICDASDQAIKGGLTSASVLRSFYEQGAELYSYDGLHSKVAVIDNRALIGSANLSENAGVGTCEASLLTDDAQIAGLILAFIEKVKNESVPVTETFLNHIESLSVAKASFGNRKSKKKIDVGTSRVWLIATRALSERLSKAEEPFEVEGLEEAEKHVREQGYEIRPIRWSGRSRFRAEAKPGDMVIEAFTEKRGTRKQVKVYEPRPMIHRQDHEKWTRFYVETPPDESYYTWKDIKADFAASAFSTSRPVPRAS